MFAFTETEGRNLASYSRYITTYFIAWIISLMGIAINNKDKNELVAILVAICLCIYPMNALSIINVFARKNQSGITDEIRWEASIIKDKVKLDEKSIFNIPK